jgi:hypothetical protein
MYTKGQGTSDLFLLFLFLFLLFLLLILHNIKLSTGALGRGCNFKVVSQDTNGVELSLMSLTEVFTVDQ